MMAAVSEKRKRKNNFDRLVRNILEVDSSPLLAKCSKNLLENKKHPSEPLLEGEQVKLIRSNKIGRVSAVSKDYVAVILNDGLTKVVGRYEVSRL